MQVEGVQVFLIRHGEVDFPQGVFYGQKDIPLSGRGKKQSKLVARRLSEARIDSIISSDLSRCTYLAECIRDFQKECEVFLSESLREINFGKWQGLSWDEIEEEYPGKMKERMNNLSSFRPPGGESLSDLLERAYPILKDVFSGRYGKRVAIACHGGVNRVLISKILGMDLQKIFSLQQDYSCVNEIFSFSNGPKVIKRLNCTCHLEGL